MPHTPVNGFVELCFYAAVGHGVFGLAVALRGSVTRALQGAVHHSFLGGILLLPPGVPVAAIGEGIADSKVVAQRSVGALLTVRTAIGGVVVDVHVVAEAALHVGIAFVVIHPGAEAEGVVVVGFVADLSGDAVAVVALRIGDGARRAAHVQAAVVFVFFGVVVGIGNEAVPLFMRRSSNGAACIDSAVSTAVLGKDTAAETGSVVQVVVRRLAD